MKLIQLEILNLASLDRQGGEVINFEKGALGDSTIFSIVGPTGSGKSTILDAICLALYGRAPRYPKKKNDKKYESVNHWFQTINMGATGEFEFEATAIDPQLILLDQHGWEIMRKPLPTNKDNATEKEKKLNDILLYDSPLVEEYQWYSDAHKVNGYHLYEFNDDKYKVVKIYKYNTSTKKWEDTKRTVTGHTSTTLADSPYAKMVRDGEEEQDKSVMSDL